MAHETMSWTPGQARELGDRWDALAAGRGAQADIFNTHAWFEAWLGARPRLAGAVAVHVVFDGTEPVALLPLVRRHGTWTSVNVDNAPRTRPVFGQEDPAPEVVSALVEQLVSSGVRDLTLHGLPARDPATRLLTSALDAAGFATEVRPRDTDNIVRVAGNDAYERTLRKLRSSAGSRERRASQFWDVEVTHYGGGARPLTEGLELFDTVQARSWKGPQRPVTLDQRRRFLAAADRHGWVRLLILSLAGRPAAANIWFSLGDVAIGWSTAYDQQLAALAPGQLLHRWVQEGVLAAGPQLLDVLPGQNPFKTSLAVEQPALLRVDASRATGVHGTFSSLRRTVRTRAPGVTELVRRSAERARAAVGSRNEQALVGAPTSEASRVAPAVDAEATDVTPLADTAALKRYVALVHGLPAAEAASSAWAADDRWFLVADQGGTALLRADPTRTSDAVGTVHEVIPLVPGTSRSSMVRGLARHLGGPVELLAPLGRPDVAGEGDLPPLPWHPAIAEPLDSP